jgi:hypothetical protein
MCFRGDGSQVLHFGLELLFFELELLDLFQEQLFIQGCSVELGACRFFAIGREAAQAQGRHDRQNHDDPCGSLRPLFA